LIAKRIFDLVCVIPGLIVLSPVFVLIAAGIKLDTSGPVLFRQTRVGRGGVHFQILKFRTMVPDAEAVGSRLTVGDDPRITRCGAVLRKYKLDELPQLWNVLRGDMSLVGPRPEVPQFVAHYGNEAASVVLSVRPGITDPASLEFYDENAMLAASENPEGLYVVEIIPRKVALYRRYVETASLWADIRIILKTIAATVTKRRSATRIRTG
jgi:lipopolysaccharide/colanic/teichoic acid biosynthesis glycosyltransferase